MGSTKKYSWGRIFHYDHDLRNIGWITDEFESIFSGDKLVLPFGLGRSYGDSCLNKNEVLIDTHNMNNLIELRV